MNTTAIGRRAEAAVADYLVARGGKVIDRNWRTRYCEIDLIVVKRTTIYFVEVKYRRQSRQGGGLDYIGPAKLRRMRFAAELWVQKHAWAGQYCLAAAAVGSNLMISDFMVI